VRRAVHESTARQGQAPYRRQEVAMCVIKSLAGILLLLTIPHVCIAQDQLSQQCGEDLAMMRYATNGVRSENSEFTLQRDRSAYYMLFVSKLDPSQGENNKGLFAPWRLLERQVQSSNYCLIAAGDRFEALLSAEYANPFKKYGMPGSGYQRCSDGKNITDGLDVRLWANKELGRSFIIQLNSDVGDNNFIFLMSDDLNWILLDESKSEISKVCYHSRGDTLVIHHDFAMPPSGK
jgi:hypothetical protein